ncbi:GntR family transcriptional regulator [Secundilactobacillus paracollinoides]|uniref:GntR family transcriptional regulator n=1 Tax=Secundilactobacillus paracollinoides TaxID=240427 RepID=A0A1B2IV33_9LACO|nr:GntR family transcriptional regulator [Secundilactobacillus paracollinoides]ANZ60132.1 GntR family transcriptional regulator [Secundilactobacillus paracollinoides]ANZ62914.1 GntR family transcriptional regulator [Secundilactobacillus paracollinoides]ANZ65926.1 GntR family transcriptional regulator [Secundilactobacillus paracollinoides]KRL78396.1 GntR family transcriptional regulator [Secundilactobacillus paracollinoides DSM 15502 = JCM 11969]
MEFDDKIPIYYQIKQYIYQEIIVNHLAPGDKLPAVRQLALTLTVNVNTIQRALGELINEGILESKRGRGNFVTTDVSTLTDMKHRVVEEQLALMYDRLADLQITPDEMVTYLTDYISKRKEQAQA